MNHHPDMATGETPSRIYSNCIVEFYLGTAKPYLPSIASAGARRYQSNRSSNTEWESNGTGPASRQFQDKVVGVMPPGLFLLIERRAVLPRHVPFVPRP